MLSLHDKYCMDIYQPEFEPVVVAIVITFLICGIRTYIYADDKTLKTLSLCMTLALITYFTHGFLNNFLDTDKLSVIVWAAMAVLTVCDLKLQNENPKLLTTNY